MPMNQNISDPAKVGTYIQQLRELLPTLQKKYPIKYLGVFGSYVRGEQSTGSDLDILEPIGLLGYARLEIELSEYLGVKIDLVSKNALKPRIGKHILAEVVQI